jgi:hypothetical protein
MAGIIKGIQKRKYAIMAVVVVCISLFLLASTGQGDSGQGFKFTVKQGNLTGDAVMAINVKLSHNCKADLIQCDFYDPLTQTIKHQTLPSTVHTQIVTRCFFEKYVVLDSNTKYAIRVLDDNGLTVPPENIEDVSIVYA